MIADSKNFSKTKKAGRKMERLCKTCKYGNYDEMQGYVCVNGESEYVADFVDEDNWCEEWEENEDD